MILSNIRLTWHRLWLCTLTYVFVLTSQVVAEPLRVGGIYGLTGPAANLGEEIRNGVLLAQADLSASGRAVEVYVEDSRWEAKQAVSALRKLATVQGLNVFHVLGSGPVLAVKPLTEVQDQLLFALAAHPDILPGSRLVLRHGNRADKDAQVLARSILIKPRRRIAALYLENDWAKYFDEELKALITAQQVEYKSLNFMPEDTDFRTMILRLTRTKPDAFVINSFGGSIAHILRQLRESKYSGDIYLNNGLSLSPDAQALVLEQNIRGFWYETYAESPPDFVNHYRKTYAFNPGSYAVIAYTDMELLAEAYRVAGPSPTRMVSYVKQLKTFKGRFRELQIDSDGDIVEPTYVRLWE